jgi:hypothetical protein
MGQMNAAMLMLQNQLAQQQQQQQMMMEQQAQQHQMMMNGYSGDAHTHPLTYKPATPINMRDRALLSTKMSTRPVTLSPSIPKKTPFATRKSTASLARFKTVW